MNRLIVLEIDGFEIESLIADHRLENIHRLLDSGTYGRLESDAAGEAAVPAPYGDFEVVLHQVESGEGPLLHFVLDAPGNLRLDGQLGLLLERLDDRTAILIHTPRTVADGCFALAGPGVPPLGRLAGIAYADLAPAILRLAGHDSGPRSALADLLGAEAPPAYTDEEAEAIVRERLSGLGYIG